MHLYLHHSWFSLADFFNFFVQLSIELWTSFDIFCRWTKYFVFLRSYTSTVGLKVMLYTFQCQPSDGHWIQSSQTLLNKNFVILPNIVSNNIFKSFLVWLETYRTSSGLLRSKKIQFWKKISGGGGGGGGGSNHSHRKSSYQPFPESIKYLKIVREILQMIEPPAIQEGLDVTVWLVRSLQNRRAPIAPRAGFSGPDELLGSQSSSRREPCKIGRCFLPVISSAGGELGGVVKR